MIIRFDIPNGFNSDIGCQTVLTMTKSKTSRKYPRFNFDPEEEVTILFSSLVTIID